MQSTQSYIEVPKMHNKDASTVAPPTTGRGSALTQRRGEEGKVIKVKEKVKEKAKIPAKEKALAKAKEKEDMARVQKAEKDTTNTRIRATIASAMRLNAPGNILRSWGVNQYAPHAGGKRWSRLR